MAHFYGTLKGRRGPATRCGSKDSGIVTQAASWEGAVRVDLFHNADEGRDWARVTLTPWQGAGTNRELYHGPVCGGAPFLKLEEGFADVKRGERGAA